MEDTDFQARSKLAHSTCVRIDYYQDGTIVTGSSGFHLGLGWVVTNFDCPSVVESQDQYFSSLIAKAVLTATNTNDEPVSFNLDKHCPFVVFSRINNVSKRCVFHSKVLSFTDFNKGDLAFLYIPALANGLFSSISSGDHAFINENTSFPHLFSGYKCTALHYGWWIEKRPDALLVSNEEVCDVNSLTFTTRNGTTSAESNGCPIYSEDFKSLLGVQFSHKGGATSASLLWDFLVHARLFQARLDRILNFSGKLSHQQHMKIEYEALKNDIRRLGYGFCFF